MLEFNNTHIFTGYLKQLLAEFNLPKFKVYTKQNKLALEQTGKEQNIIESVPAPLEEIRHKNFINRKYNDSLRYIPYIKDNQIQIYAKVNDELQWLHKNNLVYNYNQKYLNFTKNLLIKNNIYDAYTHKYLGEFLRFQRDYNDINLMPLYNCFSDELVNNLKINKQTKYNRYKKIAGELKIGTTYRLFIPFSKIAEGFIGDDVTIDIDSVDVIDCSNIAVYNGETTLPVTLSFDLIDSISISGINRLQYYNGEFYLFSADGTAYEINGDGGKKLGLFATFTISSNMTSSNLNKLKNLLGDYLYEQDNYDITISFDSTDKKYKIYSIPVKLYNKYTIAMDSNSQVEFCCGVYNKYQGASQKFDGLFEDTYLKVSSTKFNTPFIYDKLTKLAKDSVYISNLVMQEDDLRLFIKVPAEYNSTITILEGNYLHFNDCIQTPDGLAKNHAVINFENITEDFVFNPITSLQLLSVNSNKSYPFADRLIEYLSGNTITPLDTNGDNVIRVQKILETTDVSANKTKVAAGLEVVPTKITGLWNKQIQLALYQFATKDQKFINKNYNDILGYCDKDIEKYYTGYIKKANHLNETATIENVDIYTDIYQDTYKDYTGE